MLGNLLALWRGIVEFRADMTTAYGPGYSERDYWYDTGRELAHRLTLRRWDN